MLYPGLIILKMYAALDTTPMRSANHCGAGT